MRPTKKIKSESYYLSRNNEVFYINYIHNDSPYTVTGFNIETENLNSWTAYGFYYVDDDSPSKLDLVKEINPENFPEYFL